MIHQIWIGESIPQQWQQYIDSWGQHDRKLWGASDLAVYDDDIKKAELEGLHIAWKADLYRLLILRDYGGWYLDCDTEKTGDLPQLPDGFTCRYTDKPSVSVMYASSPNNDTITSIIHTGLSMDSSISAMERFGWKSLLRMQDTVNYMDNSQYLIHHNMQSWRGTHQAKTRRL